jgi:hypothetical protein
MFKKNSKYLAVLAAMLVFSILLASCQSMLANTEETDINRAEEVWGANFSAPGESYFKSYLEEMEQASVPWIDLSVPLIELRSDVPSETMESEGYAYLQASSPLIELRSDVPSEAMESEGYAYLQASSPLIELRSDAPTEAVVMVDVSSPRIEIRHIRVQARTFMTVYTVTSDGPGWVVFHADMDGEPGVMLKHIWVSDGISRINVVEVLEEMPSEPIHVMLHYDHGWTGLFEFPRTDGPVFVDDEMVNTLCFCPN